MNSNRIFTVAYLESDFTFSDPCVSLVRIVDNSDEYEWIYAIQGNIDSVLDLKVGERLAMSFNRDSVNDSQGYIKRIK